MIDKIPVSLEILQQSGNPDVAEIFVARLRHEDDKLVEFVDGLDTRFPREEKWIVNVSTQFGCPVGCVFCDAGGGFKGNLSTEEILAQVRAVLARHPGLPQSCGKLKVHFARMGEPALNSKVLAALEALPELPELRNAPELWACIPTTAPKGRDRWFAELLEIKNARYRERFQLQFSVNSTSEETRNKLMPFPHWEFKEIARYGERFHRPGERRPVLNFALAEDVPFEPVELKRYFDPQVFAVKLTPVNPTARGHENGVISMLRSEREKRLGEAIETLQAMDYTVILSIGDGREDEIGSNCGQAVRKLNEREKKNPKQ